MRFWGAMRQRIVALDPSQVRALLRLIDGVPLPGDEVVLAKLRARAAEMRDG